MAIIETVNHGPQIVSSTFWGSEYDRGGKLFCSVNAGAIRLLLPAALRTIVNECRKAEYAVLSRGPWPEMGLADAVEIMFEDHTDSPFALHLSPESFDVLPAEPEPGREWVLTLWDLKKGKPHQCLQRRCYWRRVPEIPWLKPWGGVGAVAGPGGDYKPDADAEHEGACERCGKPGLWITGAGLYLCSRHQDDY